MNASVSQTQETTQSRTWSETQDASSRLSVAKCVASIFCLSATLWLGIYAAFVALLG